MAFARRLFAIAAVIAFGATAGGCSSASTHKSTQVLQGIACPSDVDLQLVLTHACFTLAVPVDRRHPSGPKVALFVLRLTPPGTTSRDPMLVLGTDVGDIPGYGGMAALPERVHRVTYIVDPRGVGHSTPLQTCPEASKVTALTAGEGEALATAAQRCLARLRTAGDDPVLFGPDAVAADAVDLRRALGLSRWNVLTFGSASLDADALMRRDAGAVRSLVEDSPAPAGTSNVAQQTSTAYGRLVAECQATNGCRHHFPEIAGLWRQASAEVKQQPMAVPGGRLDDTALSKVVRTLLAGDGPQGPAGLPAALTTLLHGRIPASVSGVLGRDTAACVGYRPECLASVSLAAFLTAMCPSLTADPVYGQTCSSWPHTTTLTAATDHVPTLILFGALDPYVAAQSLLATSSRTTFVVQVPHQTHNALGFDECPIAIRNAWVDQPDTAPPTDCLAGMRSLPFTPS